MPYRNLFELGPFGFLVILVSDNSFRLLFLVLDVKNLFLPIGNFKATSFIHMEFV